MVASGGHVPLLPPLGSGTVLHGPVCPKTGPVLSRNVVRFVLKPGPFCPGTWSVLS